MKQAYQIKRQQLVPGTVDQVWDFFSKPENLALITPAELGLTVISPGSYEKTYPGQIIEYTVRPLFNIPFYWMTEITHVAEGHSFVDEQRFGPYRFWHHRHIFKQVNDHVEMTDVVHYRLPGWFLGNIAHSLFVKKKLDAIFDHRFRKVEELFGTI